MKRILIALIKFYRKHISPHTPPACRFYPTCSQYAMEAIERFGAFKGTGLAIWRILRCGPWTPGGYDPVPEKKVKDKKKKKSETQNSPEILQDDMLISIEPPEDEALTDRCENSEK